MKAFSIIWKIILIVLVTVLIGATYLLTNEMFDQWAQADWLWALIAIPVVTAVALFWGTNRVPAVKTSSLKLFGPGGNSVLYYLRDSLLVLRVIALAALIFAFARPQMKFSEESQSTEGIDIVIAMDLSSSMLAQDFNPNRLAAAKETAIAFVEGRKSDRFGLVAYAGNAQTLSPLTSNRNVIMQQLAACDIGLMSEDGTAIGLGLGYAVNRLRESEAPSKVIILLTDGVNNVRSYPPLTYAQTAKQFGARVYTIGVGSNGTARVPVGILPNGRYAYDSRPVEIDEETLRDIAQMTGGKYYRATDISKLKEIYAEIDELEKIKIETNVFIDPQEEFFIFALIALILLGAEFLTRHIVYRTPT